MLSWLLPSIYCGTVNYFFIITCEGVVAVNWVLLIHKRSEERRVGKECQ